VFIMHHILFIIQLLDDLLSLFQLSNYSFYYFSKFYSVLKRKYKINMENILTVRTPCILEKVSFIHDYEL